jgi:hypothetical protein
VFLRASARAYSHNTATRIASKGLREVSEGCFVGAICEWASVPPRITLVTRSWGSLRISSPTADLPVTGDVTTAQKVCAWYMVGI